MEDKKRFICPEASIIEFTNEDVIVTSGGTGTEKGQDPWDEYED